MRQIAKAWYLLLAANENMRSARFFALPCDTLDDLATQLALHARVTRSRVEPAAPQTAT